MNTNGNLSLDARRQLHTGAVVAWQSERMLAEQIGTVDRVGDLGSLILCDGARVCQDDYCRLVKADENSILAVESSRYCHGEAAGMASEPQDAPDAENPPETRPGQKPGAKGQGLALTRHAAREEAELAELESQVSASLAKAAAKKPNKLKGVQVKDHALWLKAVHAIHDRMAAGMYREVAVAQVAALPEYASLKITAANYPWWARKFRDEGKVTRSFVGGTNHPKGKAAGNKAGGCQQCLHLQAQLEAERAPHDVARDQAIRERDAARAQLASLRNDLAILTLERDNLQVELQDWKSMGPPTRPPTDTLVDRGHRTLCRLALAVCLAEVAEDARQQLAHMLGARDAKAG